MSVLDLTVPSYQAAYHFAREKALAGDRVGADTLFIRLLWLVRGEDGGFVGLSDKQLKARVRAIPALASYSMADITAAMYEPGEWPKAEARAA